MRNSTKIAVALALIADTIMVAAAGINYNSPADPTVCPPPARTAVKHPFV